MHRGKTVKRFRNYHQTSDHMYSDFRTCKTALVSNHGFICTDITTAPDGNQILWQAVSKNKRGGSNIVDMALYRGLLQFINDNKTN